MTYPEVLWFYIVWALEREGGDNPSDAGARAGRLQGQLFKPERLVPSASPWLHPMSMELALIPPTGSPHTSWANDFPGGTFSMGRIPEDNLYKVFLPFPPSGCLKKKKKRKAETIIHIWKSSTWLYGGNPRLKLWRQKRPFLWHPPGGTRSLVYSAHFRGHS